MSLPSAADNLYNLESSLRQLLEVVLSRSVGRDWLVRLVPEARRVKWAERLDTANSRRRSQGQVTVDGSQVLDYSELYEIREILSRNWEHFSGALGSKARTIALLEEVESYRNEIAHSRPLLPHQVYLLAGVAGLLRNKVVIFMSGQDPEGGHYPAFTFVRDSHGVQAEGLPTDEHQFITSTALVLRPLDVVTFELEAVDPQGRRMRVEPAQSGPDFRFEPVEFDSGERITLTWRVTDDNVSAHAFAHMQLVALGTKYHRWIGHDQAAVFQYRVDPPLR